MQEIRVEKIFSYQTLVYKNGNRTFRKKRYLDYIKEIGYQLDKTKYVGQVAVNITFHCKNKVIGDLDNITKPILDTLQEYGLIENDKNILELNLKKVFGSKENIISIEISQI
jgi:Holliday junction resolvase RusA-like endonuclease